MSDLFDDGNYTDVALDLMHEIEATFNKWLLSNPDVDIMHATYAANQAISKVSMRVRLDQRLVLARETVQRRGKTWDLKTCEELEKDEKSPLEALINTPELEKLDKQYAQKLSVTEEAFGRLYDEAYRVEERERDLLELGALINVGEFAQSLLSRIYARDEDDDLLTFINDALQELQAYHKGLKGRVDVIDTHVISEREKHWLKWLDLEPSFERVEWLEEFLDVENIFHNGCKWCIVPKVSLDEGIVRVFEED